MSCAEEAIVIDDDDNNDDDDNDDGNIGDNNYDDRDDHDNRGTDNSCDHDSNITPMKSIKEEPRTLSDDFDIDGYPLTSPEDPGLASGDSNTGSLDSCEDCSVYSVDKHSPKGHLNMPNLSIFFSKIGGMISAKRSLSENKELKRKAGPPLKRRKLSSEITNETGETNENLKGKKRVSRTKAKKRRSFPLSAPNFTVPAYSLSKSPYEHSVMTHPQISIWKMKGPIRTIGSDPHKSGDVSGNGLLTIYREYINADLASEVFSDLQWLPSAPAGVEWAKGKTNEIISDDSTCARSTVILTNKAGLECKLDESGKICEISQAWPETVKRLLKKVEEFSGNKFNACTADWFQTPQSSSKFSSLNEYYAVKNHKTIYVHLGEERTIAFKHRQYRVKEPPKDVERKDYLLVTMRHGDIMIMSGGLQLVWVHRLLPLEIEPLENQSTEFEGASIKLVFRVINKMLCK